MSTTYAEYYGALFPTAGQVASGVSYGPTGADYTGSSSGGGGEATLANQTTIIDALQDATNGLAAIRAWAEATYGSVDTLSTVLGNPVDVSLSQDFVNLSTKLGTPAGGSVSADVAAIKADTATLLGRITSAVGSMFSALVAMISAGKFTATALENTPAASVDLTPVTDELAKVPRSDTAIAAGGVYTLENQDAEEISISIRTGA